MLGINIKDIFTGKSAKVTEDNALLVTQSPSIPVEDAITFAPFSIDITRNNDGVSTNLNGSGTLNTPLDAFVTGQPLGDFYVTTANLVIADDGALSLNKIGSQAALINGVQLIYSINEKEVVLGTAKTNFDFIRLATLTKPIGGKTDAYQVSNTIGNVDSYNPVFDLARLSPYQLGIRLRQNSFDRFIFRIRDNLANIDNISLRLSGYIRFIED